MIKRIRQFFRFHKWDEGKVMKLTDGLEIPIFRYTCKKCGEHTTSLTSLATGLLCFLLNNNCKGSL